MNLRAGIEDPDTGQVSHLHLMPTLARDGPDVVMARMAELILDVISVAKLSKSDIVGIGISVPGVLDLELALTIFLPNLSGTWPKVPLRDTIVKEVGLPVTLLNDVRSITECPVKPICFSGGI